MANPLQRASIRRKAYYLAAILGLFTVSIFWRGKLAVPFASGTNWAAWLSSGSVLAQAERRELRELDQGDPEIATAAANVSFLGVRGPIITGLWWAAIEKQKRGEYHEFELYVRLVTRLQPNFITPWIFQSWNIAYNVSVENDKLGDMYFYIARGIELLAEGDRLNTKIDRNSPDFRKVGSPDIRFQIGFYYQNKFGVSDKVNTLRCLAQLSVIRPGERKAVRDSKGQVEVLPLSIRDRGIDPVAFRTFCEKNPQLVRRLRTKLNCAHPDQVAQFLADNEFIPSLYQNDTDLADDADQFPIVPAAFAEGPDEYFPGKPVDDTFDFFLAARSWFTYSLTVVPAPEKDSRGDPVAWASPRPGEYNAFRYRIPRSPALIIFRQQPPRAQTYLAERMKKEGWFDQTTTWDPDERVGSTSMWFPRTGEAPSVVLRTPTNSQDQYAKAWEMWDYHGKINGLVLPPGKRQQLEDTAGVRGSPTSFPPDLSDRELEAAGWTKDKYVAYKALIYYEQNRSMTNFPYFLEATRAEKDSVTIAARKLLWDADQARQNAENNRASRLYVQAMARWREVLTAFPQYHRPERSSQTEEDTAELTITLMLLLKEDGAVQARADRAAATCDVFFPGLGEVAKPDLLQAAAEDEAEARVAVESMMTVFPRLPLQQSAPESKALKRMEEIVAADVLALLQATPTAKDPLPTDLAKVRTVVGRSESAAGIAGVAITQTVSDRAVGVFADLYRPLAAHKVIDGEFAWMKQFKYVPLIRDSQGQYETGAYWVTPAILSGIKVRQGLVRQPEAPSAVPEGGDGVSPPSPPGR